MGVWGSFWPQNGFWGSFWPQNSIGGQNRLKDTQSHSMTHKIAFYPYWEWNVCVFNRNVCFWMKKWKMTHKIAFDVYFYVQLHQNTLNDWKTNRCKRKSEQETEKEQALILSSKMNIRLLKFFSQSQVFFVCTHSLTFIARMCVNVEWMNCKQKKWKKSQKIWAECRFFFWKTWFPVNFLFLEVQKW